jgi:hypothetical protein
MAGGEFNAGRVIERVDSPVPDVIGFVDEFGQIAA